MRFRLLAILTVMVLLILPGISQGQVEFFRFIHPASGTITPDRATDGTYTIEWENPDPDWYFLLYYYPYDFPGEPTQIDNVLLPASDLQYTDTNTARVSDGNYYVQALATNASFTAIPEVLQSEGYVTIDNSSGPQPGFTFINPPRSNADAAPPDPFRIQWNTGTRGILNLYYDLNSSGDYNEDNKINQLAITIPDSNSFPWDTSTIQSPGCYYICAGVTEAGSLDPEEQIFWSEGCVNINNDGGVDFTFIKPVGRDVADDSYMIEWNTQISGTLDLYFSISEQTYNPTDNINNTSIPIPGLGSTQTHNWLTGGLEGSTYWVIAEVTPFGEPMLDPIWSPGTVTVTDKDFYFTQPPPQGDTAGESGELTYNIEWNYIVTGPSVPGTTISLYYDTDMDVTNGMTLIQEQITTNETSFPWAFGSLQGTYFIYGEVWAPGDGPAIPGEDNEQLIEWNYSGPLFLIQGEVPDFIILRPSRPDEPADKSYIIQYRTSVTGTLVLWADSDNIKGNNIPLQISPEIPVLPGSENKDFKWSTIGEPNGSRRWIYGNITVEGLQDPIAEDYSTGNLLIQHIAEPDTTSPGQITDLFSFPPASGNPNAIELRWTAPANDGNIVESGPASEYSIRYSQNPNMVEDDWETYLGAGMILPPPKPPERDESFTVTGLDEDTRYYFAIRTGDESQNWSGISNISVAETVPVELTEFYAIAGDSVITLFWTTATETDNLGWNILRNGGNSREFVKINSRLIKGAGTSSTPHSYTYDDFNVRIGVLYTYVLESVSTSGGLEYSDPVQVMARGSTKPVILWGGYFDTNVSVRFGGNFVLKAYIESVYPIDNVELLYKGIPTRIHLNDEGINGDEIEGDNVFTFSANMEPGIGVGQYIFELKAVDINGNESDVFPYLTVK